MSDIDLADPEDSDECPDCGFTLAGDLSGTLERTPRSREFPCESCLWAYGPLDERNSVAERPDAPELLRNLRRRLGFTVMGIDAGRFKRPEDAVEEILATLGSVYRPHRQELSVWLRSIDFEDLP